MRSVAEIPVLVVDDYPLVAATIKALLESEGFRDVELADGAPQALEKAARRTYGLVISDWKMPGMTGLDLLQAFRSKGDKDTRFLIVTAHKEVDSAALERAGVHGVMLKPFSGGALRERIEAVCSASPAS